jgi:hypothetical protein
LVIRIRITKTEYIIGEACKIHQEVKHYKATEGIPLRKNGEPCAVIVVGQKCDDLEHKVAKIFQDKIKERMQCKVKIVNLENLGRNNDKHKTVIIIGSATVNDILRESVEKGKVKIPTLDYPGPEGFVLKTLSQGNLFYVFVAGSDSRGTLYGVGKLLREVQFEEKSIVVPELDIVDKPVQQIRATLFAIHIQDVGYKLWSRDDFERYIQELALWGMNTVFYIPLQFGQRTESIWNGTEREKATWQICMDIPRIAKSLGLDVGIYLGINDVFPGQASQFKKAKRGLSQYIIIMPEQAHICPSDPKARALILDLRERLFEKLPYIDFMYIPTTDYGGCACDDCRPYLKKTYFALVKDITERLRKHHPNANVIVSTQMISREGLEKVFCKYLQEKPTWVNYVACSMGFAFTIEELLSRIPPRYKILLYPDITMRDSWGDCGATPWVKEFNYTLERSWDWVAAAIREERIEIWYYPGGVGRALPLAYDFDTMGDKVSGSFTYSEGVHDDIAKIIWLQKNWTPTKDVIEILREYCQYYYGQAVLDNVVQAILKMENISDYRTRKKSHNPKLIDFDNPTIVDNALDTVELLKKVEKRMQISSVNSWRWKILMLRAKIDTLIIRVKQSITTGRPSKKADHERGLSLSGPECKSFEERIIRRAKNRTTHGGVRSKQCGYSFLAHFYRWEGSVSK